PLSKESNASPPALPAAPPVPDLSEDVAPAPPPPPPAATSSRDASDTTAPGQVDPHEVVRTSDAPPPPPAPLGAPWPPPFHPPAPPEPVCPLESETNGCPTPPTSTYSGAPGVTDRTPLALPPAPPGAV